jgi:hypothetical protein
MFWTQRCTRHMTTTNKTNNTTLYVSRVLCMVVSNTYSAVLFVLFVVVCVLFMVVSNSYSVVLFVLFVVIHILGVGHNHTQDTWRRQTRQITQHYMCWTQPYTRHRRRQTRQIIQHYMCWKQPLLCCVICLVCRRPVSCVWLCPTHIVLCYLSCLSSSRVLCMVVSNT